jgi:hypothetical protein
MAFQLTRQIGTVMLMVPVCPEPGFRSGGRPTGGRHAGTTVASAVKTVRQVARADQIERLEDSAYSPPGWALSSTVATGEDGHVLHAYGVN